MSNLITCKVAKILNYILLNVSFNYTLIFEIIIYNLKLYLQNWRIPWRRKWANSSPQSKANVSCSEGAYYDVPLSLPLSFRIFLFSPLSFLIFLCVILVFITLSCRGLHHQNSQTLLQMISHGCTISITTIVVVL